MMPIPPPDHPRQFSVHPARPLGIGSCAVVVTAMAFFAVHKGQPPREPPRADAVIRAQAGDSEIVITTTSRLAGAIHSLTWNGKEFIDSADHGRQLQSAANFDLEALTGYMPAEFEKFWTFDPKTGNLAALDDGPGEQSQPVVFSTADEQFAMGVIAAEAPPAGTAGPGYGRFRFRAEKVVKWNCVYRVRNAAGVPSGKYSYRMYVAVGTREIVRQTLKALAGP